MNHIYPASLKASKTVHRLTTADEADQLMCAQKRVYVFITFFTVLFTAVTWRLSDLMLQQSDTPSALPDAPLSLSRQDIIDRNGVVLATNLPIVSVSADPQDILHPQETAQAIHRILPHIKAAEMVKKLIKPKCRFVWVDRNITPKQQQALNKAGIVGLTFHKETKRFYPHGRLTSHIVGFTDVDNHGLAGIEKTCEPLLQNPLSPLCLSMDVRVQSLLHELLTARIKKFSGIGGCAMVMDVTTSEIIGMVSLPDFDSNDPGASPRSTMFNQATLGVYEMGSCFKLLNTAMALDAGVASFKTKYDARQPLKVARFTIKDYRSKNKRWLTVPEIVLYSSNIGSARMALAVGKETQKAFFKDMGFLKPLSLELPEKGRPLYPRTWRDINAMTMAFGHGIAVTPLHTITAMCSLVNGGLYNEPTLRRRNRENMVSRMVIGPATSEKMRRLMRTVVTHGCGRKSEVPAYLVGGKTSTAEKVGRGGYSKTKNLSSFLGCFPMHQPRYMILAMVDEPKGIKETYGFRTGGWVSAPLVKGIIQHIGPLLGVEPLKQAEQTIFKKTFYALGD
jgi:cell division protein FtsI (penicillin-binding protein 3)